MEARSDESATRIDGSNVKLAPLQDPFSFFHFFIVHDFWMCFVCVLRTKKCSQRCPDRDLACSNERSRRVLSGPSFRNGNEPLCVEVLPFRSRNRNLVLMLYIDFRNSNSGLAPIWAWPIKAVPVRALPHQPIGPWPIRASQLTSQPGYNTTTTITTMTNGFWRHVRGSRKVVSNNQTRHIQG